MSSNKHLWAGCVIAIEILAPAAAVSQGAEADLPIPLEAPDRPGDLDGADTQDQEDVEEEQAGPPAQTRPSENAGMTTACETALQQLGVEFEVGEPIPGDGVCGVDRPYRIVSIEPGIRVRPDTNLRCPAALALANWTKTVVIPAARRLTGDGSPTGALTQIQTSSTYVCRRRNNLPDGKVSEHGFGNAVDIGGFEFEERPPLGIAPREGDGDLEEAFQRTVRAGACLYFTTVLGPGSDAYHDDHLHLDIAERNGSFRLCQ